MFMPADGELHALAVKYADENLSRPIDFLEYKNTWIACEINAEGKPIRAMGILSMVLRPDFPICRFTDNAACLKLVERASDYLHDQGARGAEVTVHIAANEQPDQRCPNWEGWIKAFGMTPADRYLFTIK